MNIIIGAGIGGLSTAIRLAAAGQKVAIYEQNTAVGGKMSQITAAGYRWDTGPSVITMRHVFEELFASAGRQLADYLTPPPRRATHPLLFPRWHSARCEPRHGHHPRPHRPSQPPR
ncbi:MAG: FAD-dependent oxidoreductase [Chloroflexi bacterium]|nr:FAD-dependent oxidoreductase [Chloroflexota bacterium]